MKNPEQEKRVMILWIGIFYKMTKSQERPDMMFFLENPYEAV
jgi:hypothetical protein